MSFSSEVKEELSRHISPARHCRIAEIAAIISICGRMEEDENGKLAITVVTENAAVARAVSVVEVGVLNKNAFFSIKNLHICIFCSTFAAEMNEGA